MTTWTDIMQSKTTSYAFFWFGGILGSASRAEFPISLSNHAGFTPRLLYSSTHHSPDGFIHLKTGWARDAWLQWSYENCFFPLDISCWPTSYGIWDFFPITSTGMGGTPRPGTPLLPRWRHCRAFAILNHAHLKYGYPYPSGWSILREDDVPAIRRNILWKKYSYAIIAGVALLSDFRVKKMCYIYIYILKNEKKGGKGGSRTFWRHIEMNIWL